MRVSKGRKGRKLRDKIRIILNEEERSEGVKLPPIRNSNLSEQNSYQWKKYYNEHLS